MSDDDIIFYNSGSGSYDNSGSEYYDNSGSVSYDYSGSGSGSDIDIFKNNNKEDNYVYVYIIVGVLLIISGIIGLSFIIFIKNTNKLVHRVPNVNNLPVVTSTNINRNMTMNSFPTQTSYVWNGILISYLKFFLFRIHIMLKNLINLLPKHSYGRFLLLNPKSSKKNRCKAIKKFLDKVH